MSEECRHGNMSRAVCGDGLTARRVRTGLENSDDSRSCSTEPSSVEHARRHKHTHRARSPTAATGPGLFFFAIFQLSTATGSALNGRRGSEERVRA